MTPRIITELNKIKWNIINFANRLKKEDILGRITLFLALSILHFSSYLHLIRKDRNIWLIGENAGQCLQDNGYFFYSYCKTQHHQRLVYFLIKNSSPYYKDLRNDPRAIRYGSLKHAYLFFLADTCLYTHTYRDIIYKNYFCIFKKNKKLIYLHHGFLAFKKFDDFYFKNKNIMDIFTIGSNLEADILQNEIGVHPQKLKITGYARYDWLNNISQDQHNQIAYIPTHRNIYNRDNIENLIRKTNSFINNKSLDTILINSQTILKVYLHQAISDYSKKLHSNSKNVQIIPFDEEPCANLIGKSKLLITDYSGISWDFIYLGKPVIFYRFDIDAYLSERQSYLPLDKEIIGDIIYVESDLVSKINETINKKFIFNKKYTEIRNSIFPYYDRNNCSRIFEEVDNLTNDLLLKVTGLGKTA